MVSVINSPLFLDGWLEFNRVKWNVQPLRFMYSPDGSHLPAVEAVLYLNKRGKIVHPRINPYLPIAFKSTPAQSQYKRDRQWLEVATPLARDMCVRGLRSTVAFAPEAADIRPWQWAGFHSNVRYTFYIDFPFDLQLIDKATRNRIRKAHKEGYRCERTTNMAHVHACMQATEQRQRFHWGLTVCDLECARTLLTDESFRAYVCYAPNGEPASVSVDLHCPGTRAVGWLGGTSMHHLQSGATQLVQAYVLEDLEAAGATGYDLAGANIPSVAAAKLSWGGRLVPFYRVEAYTARNLAKWVLNYFQVIRASGPGICRA